MAYTTINKSTDHHGTMTWSGNNSTQTITFAAYNGSAQFQPDWTWIKQRNGTADHRIVDAVRGATKDIYSNLTAVEGTNTNGLTAFNSDGFVLGSDGGYNGSGGTYVGWSWKAGTTGSGTTGGSGTAKDYQYSVNTTAGFSIIKYKGNGTAGHTIPHHLGAVPKMIIVKCTESVHNWQVLHQGLADNSGTKNLELNSTSAVLTDSTTWNNTAPTSTVFTLGSTNPTNQSSSNFNFVAYCFAEKTGYSKFGSYEGNGNDNGQFIYTGFKPAWIMIKRTDGADTWRMYDNKRIGFNVDNNPLFANDTTTESTDNDIDFLSNGFKIRRNSGSVNTNGANNIYMAFGQSLVGSNNIPATAR
jgi:hypothetical protein